MKLSITESLNETLIRRSTKIFATLSFNDNPEYSWCLFFKNGMVLSGFKTKEAAIERAQKMSDEWLGILKNLNK